MPTPRKSWSTPSLTAGWVWILAPSPWPTSNQVHKTKQKNRIDDCRTEQNRTEQNRQNRIELNWWFIRIVDRINRNISRRQLTERIEYVKALLTNPIAISTYPINISTYPIYISTTISSVFLPIFRIPYIIILTTFLSFHLIIVLTTLLSF